MKIVFEFIILVLILSNCSDKIETEINADKITAKRSDSLLWPKINLKSWQSTPSINGRLATEEDVKNGFAIYCINKVDSKPYPIQLPQLAYLNDFDTKTKKMVVVIQIESTSKDTIAGYRDINGGFGACLFYELQILSPEDQIKIETQ
jgi:hypothetical protein